jgi:hypothetical protein
MSTNEKIINTLLNNIDFLHIPNTANKDSVEKKVIGNLYKGLHRSYKKIKKMSKNRKISVNTIRCNNKKDIPRSSLFDSHFCVDNFNDIVNKHTKRVIVYNCVLRNIKVTINLNNLTPGNTIHKYTIHHVLAMIDLLLSYANITKMKTINIFLYLTDKEKTLPLSNMCVLNKEHVNSAVTYRCSVDGEILIFRKEEWLKCLIHELFHSLCLDFMELHSDINVKSFLKTLFCIKSDYLLSESYNEWWATNLNCLLYSFMMLENKSNKSECLSFYKVCLTTEQMFSMLQITKVLNHMGLNYNILIDDNVDNHIKENLYKEDSNVFCYYVIKGLLLFYNNSTIDFFKKNNTSLLNFDKTPQTLRNFLNLIRKYYKTDEVKKTLQKYSEYYSSLNKMDKTIQKLLNTTQMTLNSV